MWWINCTINATGDQTDLIWGQSTLEVEAPHQETYLAMMQSKEFCFDVFFLKGSGVKSSQFHFICIALNYSYSLKGLYRPYIYDIP